MESELKLELDAAAYETLLALAGGGRTVEQINTFYDTPGRDLRGAGWALRLRREGEQAYLTAKGGAVSQRNGYFVRPEVEAAIGLETATALAPGFRLSEAPRDVVGGLVEACGDAVVVPVCAFVNYRTRVRAGRWSFDLDRTLIGGVVLHELEMEGAGEGLDLQDWLRGRGLAFEPATRSKLAVAMSLSADGPR
jgi:CYTH domain-containing protein